MSRHIEECRRELARVIDLLRDEPRGLSITDISKSLDMNRNSVSKYLNMLVISGRVDMRTVGVAKVYFLSSRVPISSLLDFSSDAVLVLNGSQEIVLANANFLAFSGRKPDDVIGKRLPETALPVVSRAEITRQVGEVLRRPEGGREIEWEDDSNGFFFLIKLIPTVFDDGSPGIAVILEDVTALKRALRGTEEPAE